MGGNDYQSKRILFSKRSAHLNSISIWEVACWNKDDTAQWYLEFKDETAARKKYERWR